MMINKIKKVFRHSFLKNTLGTLPSLIFFVTSHCNARCSHCFNWRNLNQQSDLTLNEIEVLSEQLGKIDSLLLSGGEPFLRKDLVEICHLFLEKNNVTTISIPTNGINSSIIRQKTREILKLACNRNIFVRISLDGTEEIHDRIHRVPGAFKKAINSFCYLAELRSEFSNLNIGINATVWNENYENLFELIVELKKQLADLQNFNISLLRGTPKDKTYKLPCNDNLMKLHEYIKKNFDKNKSLISRTIEDVIFRLNMKGLSLKKQILSCQAGRLIGVIDANGDVRLCELLPPIGNLRKASFGDIWQSKTADVARKKIADRQCWCTHECFLYPTVLAHIEYYPVLLCALVKNWLCAKN